MICCHCGMPVRENIIEKIITPDGKAYHMKCWRPHVSDEDLAV